MILFTNMTTQSPAAHTDVEVCEILDFFRHLQIEVKSANVTLDRMSQMAETIQAITLTLGD
jgi:hypothetical protein